jgi:ribosomal protein S18 acetylase RimI-like enzyme
MAVTGVTYFKRFRMEIDLREISPVAPILPDGYHWESWQPLLLERHAGAKWESFRSELDSHVFECLGNYHGCVHLMQEIYNRDTFLANATWLISYDPAWGGKSVDCATIQGLAQAGSLGAIQNVGVTPPHRGRGLGRALVLKSLEGFRLAEMSRVYLEVTAQNTAAVELYRSLGFRVTRTVYKAVEEDFTIY